MAARKERLPGTERQLVSCAHHKPVRHIPVRAASVSLPVVNVLHHAAFTLAVVEALGERVAAGKAQTVGQALLQLHLQAVIARLGIIEHRRDSRPRRKRPPQLYIAWARNRPVDIGPEHVTRSFVSHIRGGKQKIARQLTFEREIPLLDIGVLAVRILISCRIENTGHR